jgi:hypothetical protein
VSSSLDKFKTRPPEAPARKRHKPFEARFTQLPEFWGTELEKLKSAATWHLARRILREALRRRFIPGPITLSKEMTGLARTSRCRAARNMVRRGLIRVKQQGHHAAIVTELLLGGGETIRLEED